MKERAEETLKAELQEWNETKFGGLNHVRANRKAKSVFFMMLGEEGQRRYEQRYPHFSVKLLKFDEFWYNLEEIFLKCRNVIVDRVKFFPRRRQDHESLEQFYGILTGLASKSQLAHLERELVRDVFISNLNVPELQKKFCSKPYTPEKVLQLALSHERGLADQQSLNSCSMGLALPTLGNTEKSKGNTQEPICAVQNNSQNRGSRQYPSVNKSKPCRNCGGPFKQGHQNSCPAKTVTCRNCQKQGHLARVCRSAPTGESRTNPRTSQGRD